VRWEQLTVLSEQLQRVVQEHVEGLGQVLLLVRAKENKHDNMRQDKRKKMGKHEKE
jgi:hypothetical protein